MNAPQVAPLHGLKQSSGGCDGGGDGGGAGGGVGGGDGGVGGLQQPRQSQSRVDGDVNRMVQNVSTKSRQVPVAPEPHGFAQSGGCRGGEAGGEGLGGGGEGGGGDGGGDGGGGENGGGALVQISPSYGPRPCNHTSSVSWSMTIQLSFSPAITTATSLRYPLRLFGTAPAKSSSILKMLHAFSKHIVADAARLRASRIRESSCLMLNSSLP